MLQRIAILVVSLVAACASAQWVKQAPYPANRDLQGVYFVTPEIGFISGDDHILMRTTDGGQTWAQAAGIPRDAFGLKPPIWDIQFPDSQTGFAFGNFGWRTFDGGDSWQSLSTPIGAYGMDFVSPTTGIIFNRRAAYVTEDSGTTWTPSIPHDLDHFVMDIDFFDANLGLAVGEKDNTIGVFRTTNFGQTWQQISSQQFDRVLFLTETTVIASRESAFYRSVDGGETWTPQGLTLNPLSQTAIEAITKVTESVAAAVCFDASIWMTHDSGVTWTKVKEPTGVWGFELDIHFTTPQVGYAVGRAGLIYKTTDGGATWTQINNGAARALYDVQMRPSGLGLAVGEEGVVLRTTNFGETWTASQMRGEGQFWHNVDLNTIEFIDEDTIIVGGYYGRVFRSDDAGLSWAQLAEFSLNGLVYDTFFINENEGWVTAMLNAPRGSIEHTTDGGQTWTRVVDRETYNTRLHMFDANAGLALERSRGQLRTPDKFFNFTIEDLNPNDQWIDMEFIGDLGWYGGESGHIMRTFNRGLTFTESILPDWDPTWDRLADVDPQTQSHVLVAARRGDGLGSGVIYDSTDGGASWTTLPLITTPDSQIGSQILAIDAFEGGPIWAVADGGYVFRLGDPGTSVTPSSLTVIRGSVLEGTLASVQQSDDNRLILRPGVTLSTSQNPIVLEFTANSGQSTNGELKLSVENSATSANVQLAIEMFDYDAGTYVQMLVTPSTTSDSVLEISRSDADRWISSSGEVKCRISYRATGPVLSFPWSSRLDLVRWDLP